MLSNFDKNIKFVATHYRHGAFDKRRAWMGLGVFGARKYPFLRIAGAAAIAIAITATATVLIRNEFFATDSETRIVEAVESPVVEAPAVKPVDFDNAPLPIVIDIVCELYDVRITNIPDNAADYRLTIHYVGTANDLVATINELLGLELEVEEK